MSAQNNTLIWTRNQPGMGLKVLRNWYAKSGLQLQPLIGIIIARWEPRMQMLYRGVRAILIS